MANRAAAALGLREGDREVLARLTRATSGRAGLAQRARIVLLAADGESNTAIAVFDSPSAANNTIRARCANPALPEVARVSRANTSRSPSRNPSAAAARFAIPHHPSNPTVNQLTTRTTSNRVVGHHDPCGLCAHDG